MNKDTQKSTGENKRTPRPKLPPNERMALSIGATADVLGVHPNTVRNWIKAKELQTERIGRLVFISRQALEERLAGNRTAG